MFLIGNTHVTQVVQKLHMRVTRTYIIHETGIGEFLILFLLMCARFILLSLGVHGK